MIRLSHRGIVVGMALVTSTVVVGPAPAVAQANAYLVIITTPTGHPVTGATFSVSGSVSPDAPGELVRLQQRVGGRFHGVASQQLSDDSTYDFSLVTDAVGSFVYRVKKPASDSHGAGFSENRRIVVTTRFAKHSKARAQSWVDAQVPYDSSLSYTNRYGTYRQDCSGYVSLAWGLASSYTTATLPDISHRVPKARLHRGDVLLHPSSAGGSGHVVYFDKWADTEHSSYLAYEESPSSGAVHHVIPYPYWEGSGSYRPYRRDAT